MGKSFEKRLVEEGIPKQEVIDYVQVEGFPAAMDKYQVGFSALSRVVGPQITDPSFYRLSLVGSEMAGKDFADFLQQLLDFYYRLRESLKERDALIEKQNLEIKYLRSMAQKAWIPKMAELMRVCQEE